MNDKQTIDALTETNEILDGLEWQGMPIRRVEMIRTGLPEAEWLQLQVLSRWDVSWGKPIKSTRWSRFKYRWQRRRERLVEAYKVFTGELEAREWDDYV